MGGEVERDLSGRTPEFCDALEFLLDERGVAWTWRGYTLVVDAADVAELDDALRYLSSERSPAPGDDGEGAGGDGRSRADSREPLIATREEAWWCLAGTGGFALALLVWATVLITQPDDGSIAIPFIVGGAASGSAAWFWFNALRVRRAPDTFPSFFDRFMRFRFGPDPDLRMLESQFDAFDLLRAERTTRPRHRRPRGKRRERNRVGPRSAPPPPG